MIVCQGLTHAYGRKPTVEALSLTLPAGSLCALLGPNGAGKSTTVKLLTGQLRPTAGWARVAGHDVSAGGVELRRAIGVLPDRLGLFDHLTVEEHLLMSGPIYGLSAGETEARSEDLLRLLGLEASRYTHADHCSHGTRKKAALALALLHAPQVLFLDEPFEGVDPVTVQAIRELLQALARGGVTVLFTAHNLSLVARTATHALCLRHGRVVWDGAAGDFPVDFEERYFELMEASAPHPLPWLHSQPS